MKLGYARVSTPDQKLDAQLDALTAAGCERIFTDTLSSTREGRPGLADALSHLRRDDMLVVTKLDRLGRSVKGLIALTEQLQAKGIGFQSLHQQPVPIGARRYFTHLTANHHLLLVLGELGTTQRCGRRCRALRG